MDSLINYPTEVQFLVSTIGSEFPFGAMSNILLQYSFKYRQTHINDLTFLLLLTKWENVRTEMSCRMQHMTKVYKCSRQGTNFNVLWVDLRETLSENGIAFRNFEFILAQTPYLM